MKLSALIDPWITDFRAQSRVNSRHSEDAYRYALQCLVDDTGDTDVAAVTKAQVKRTLARWPRAVTRRARHAAITSFFDWAMEEDHCPTSPARQVPKVRTKKHGINRLTHPEIVALLDAAEPVRRDRWAINLLLYTGARNAELRGLTARDLAREGWVRLHGKGDKERWVPVVPELAPVVAEILTLVEPEGFVLPGLRNADPPYNTRQFDSKQMLSSSSLRRQVMRVGDRAGIALHLHPHLLRHAYADAIVRFAGARVAQTLLGHESIETTVGTYTAAASLDELAASTTGFGFRSQSLPVKTTEGDVR